MTPEPRSPPSSPTHYNVRVPVSSYKFANFARENAVRIFLKIDSFVKYDPDLDCSNPELPGGGQSKTAIRLRKSPLKLPRPKITYLTA